MAVTVTFTGLQDTIRNPLTVQTTGTILGFPSITRSIQVSVGGANGLRLYRNVADFTADTNYIDLAGTTGFFDGPCVCKTFYLRAVGGSTTCTVSVYYSDGLAIV